MKKLAALVFALALVMTGQLFENQALAGPPTVISFGTHTVGTGGHRLVSLAAESIIEKTGVKARCVPAGSDVARAMMARHGESDTAALNSLAAWTLQEGLFEYSAPNWGPQPVCYLWIPEHIGAVLGVRGDSKVKKIEDLKGLKVASFPGSPGQHLMNEALLAFGGVTWKDVTPVPHTGASAAYDAVIKQRVDASFFNISGNKAAELAAMPCGIRYLEVPKSDREGWKRLKAVAPMMSPKHSTVGADITPEKPVWTMTQGYPTFLAWSSLPEETAYTITKLLNENYDAYASKHKSMKNDWTLEKTLSLFDGDVVPMHPGAVRYFKEIGKWSDERETMNQERLANQITLKELWEETIKEGKSKKLDDKAVSKLWLEKRAAAGMWVPQD